MTGKTKVASRFALAATLIAAPALLQAQVAGEPAGPSAPTTAQPRQSAPPAQTLPQPGTTAIPASDPATNPPSPQAQATQPDDQTTQVAAFVEQQFPAADADGDGSLSAAEFEPWIAKLKSTELRSAARPVDEAEVKTYASNAFAKADTDSSESLSKDELIKFLMG